MVSKRTIPLLNSLNTLSLVKHKVFRETLAQRCKLGRSNLSSIFEIEAMTILEKVNEWLTPSSPLPVVMNILLKQ